MFATIYEMKEATKGHGFKTTLADSFIGFLASALKDRGFRLLNITDEFKGNKTVRVITTDQTRIEMFGSFSVNDVLRVHQAHTRFNGLTDELDYYAWLKHDRGKLSTAQKKAVKEIIESLSMFGTEAKKWIKLAKDLLK